MENSFNIWRYNFITLENSNQDYRMRDSPHVVYSNVNSLKYEKPVQVNIPSTIKSITLRDGKKISKVNAYSVIKEAKK